MLFDDQKCMTKKVSGDTNFLQREPYGKRSMNIRITLYVSITLANEACADNKIDNRLSFGVPIALIADVTKSAWLRRSDIKPPDQPVFEAKNVPDHLIGEEIPFEIAHHLVHLDDYFRFRAFGKRHRLDARVDHCPLPRPVAPYFFSPVDIAPLHTIRPNDIFVQGCKHRLHVASVEAIVNSLK